MCANKYIDNFGSWKKMHVALGYTLCKKLTKKQFVQQKTINIMGRKTTLFLRLSSAYYAFGYKKYICKKCYMRGRLGFTVGICNTCKGFDYINFSNHLKGDNIKRSH